MKSPLEACRDHTKPEFNKNIDAALFKIRNEDYPWLAQPSAKEVRPAPGHPLNNPEATYEVRPAPGHLLNFPEKTYIWPHPSRETVPPPQVNR